MTDTNSQREKSIETLKSALIGLLFLIAGWNYNSMQRLEDRLYAMSSNAMTQSNAQQLEERISRSIDVRFSDLSNRLDLILKLVQADSNNRKQ